MRTLVLIGGGHSHAIVLRLLELLPDVRLVLITNVTHAPYSGMLPGHLSGFYSFADCHIDLQMLAKFAQAEFILDEVIGLDLQQQQVLCGQHSPIDFDWLSIDIGSTPATMSIPGVKEYAVSFGCLARVFTAIDRSTCIDRDCGWWGWGRGAGFEFAESTPGKCRDPFGTSSARTDE
jgi:selenide, water dikinase